MSNFAFLQTQWPDLYQSARRVEEYVYGDPRSACFYARRTLELAVQWLYQHDPALQYPYDDNLSVLLNEPSFRQSIPSAIHAKAHLLRKEGNLAVHAKKEIEARVALNTAVELHHLLYWLARTYTAGDPTALTPAQFAESNLPPAPLKLVKQSLVQLQKLEEQLHQQDQQLRQQRAENEQLKAQIAQLQALTAVRKRANAAIPDPHNYSEGQTRQALIDVLLREAGWDPTAPRTAEYPLVGMPTKGGKGRADYVLWGADGLPLGVVEAKKTAADARQGQQQAQLYANCLEQMHGRRPLIFYSNGYETYLWDDQHSPPRSVQGFYTPDQLERLIQRRTTAVADLTAVPPNEAIAGRHYQKEALGRLAAHFHKRFRKGLLVMATGTGKTRTAVALVELLLRANWAKRILFLADRTTLVQQATNAFNQHLPASAPVNLLEADNFAHAVSARVALCTYQTMLNLLDKRDSDGRALFTVGHFDLLIVDEAHRSIYHKYGGIFNYFDSLLVGLTATPKDEVDRNTYHLFDLEEGVPTYAYDLETAVADGYLVPYQGLSLNTQFTREGIVYDNLSEAEKLEWELLDWDDTEAIPDKVEASAINNWLFNKDTVDHILAALMTHGLKVAGGDRLGKTIIFAKSHAHAQFIVDRFDANYPHYAGQFAQLVDYSVKNAQSIIDNFKKADSAPHIAVSVDMLDTGIDVPEVVNLLFFKPVHSKTKFWQMIGRGTRLCPDLFGLGEDKTHFLVLDVGRNFEFFSEYPQGAGENAAVPLGQRLFTQRLNLLAELQKWQITADDPALAPLATQLADELHATVAAMNVDNFLVRPARRTVEPFQVRGRWEALSPADVADLTRQVAALPSQRPDEEEGAKRFDLLILQLQAAHWAKQTNKFAQLRGRVEGVAAHLLLPSKQTIPLVRAQRPLLQAIGTEVYWRNISLPLLEELRLELRGLMFAVDKAMRKPLQTDFVDELEPIKDESLPYVVAGVNVAQYRRKVETFLRQHEDYWVIQKIRWGIPLDGYDLAALEEFFFSADDVGGRETFEARVGPQPDLPRFIRSLVGLDRKAAKAKFNQFLDGSRYTADQIQFVNFVIEQLTQNGAMSAEMLYERPFTDLHPLGVSGVFAPEDAQVLTGVLAAVG
ncbi:MAG: DEAD/DEAH box helicase family protein [Chloroflexi bacterium]|nr:DEAD/DEAH box helicase family protein [Chloroflexota bacterium]